MTGIALGGYDNCGMIALMGYGPQCDTSGTTRVKSKSKSKSKVIQETQGDLQHDIIYFATDTLVFGIQFQRLADLLHRLDIHTVSDLRHYIKQNLTHEAYHRLDIQTRRNMYWIIRHVAYSDLHHNQQYNVIPDIFGTLGISGTEDWI